MFVLRSCIVCFNLIKYNNSEKCFNLIGKKYVGLGNLTKMSSKYYITPLFKIVRFSKIIIILIFNYLSTFKIPRKPNDYQEKLVFITRVFSLH